MPQKYLALITEAACIGCTKCIDVCPTDAILGADRLMHTVISKECIGCQLCIPACPVDCIQLITPAESYIGLDKEEIKIRVNRRKLRLNKIETSFTTADNRKDYLNAALKRARDKPKQADASSFPEK